MACPPPEGPPRCARFSLCSLRELHAFHSQLPLVESTASPWYGYLVAVYGGPVALPFELRQLRLFWKDTPLWRRRSPRPRVGLPLRECVGRPRPREWARSISNRSMFTRPDAVQPDCANDVCSQWLPPLPALPPPATTRPPPLPWRQMIITHRAEYVELRHVAAAARQPTHAAGAWVEVTRSDFSQITSEGMRGYGCWFYPLAGSGLFVSAGRTYVVPDAHRVSDTTADHPLMREFVQHGGRVDAIPRPEGDFTALQQKPELQPYAAHVLGYDSLQLLARHPLSGPGELVVTSAPCAHAPAPLRACVPLEIRTGWRANRPCRCDDRASVLNCLGSVLNQR